MSSALAIAAVTATLKDLLNDGLLNHDLSMIGSFSVTASPPDRITVGTNEPNQLNVFLYQVTANLGWRNSDLPSRAGNGTRLTNPPLALDLHYMLTAYGSQDLNAEILLGYAMQLLHETPMLTRDQLRTVLGAPSPVTGSILPPLFGNLSAIDLADQVELLKISPVFLSTEDLSKMWTAMQARYRPTMAYLVSVVLIQATDSIQSAPPVLKRGKDDRGPSAVAAPAPSLIAVRPLASDLLPALRLGDDLLLTGTGLDSAGTITAVLENADQGLSAELATALSVSPAGLKAHVPSVADAAAAMHLWAVGMYTVTLHVSLPNVPLYPSNSVPIALAPIITVAPLSASAGGTITLTCTPRLNADQVANTSVIFGSQSVAPASIVTPANPLQPTTITFDVPAVPAGNYLVRLRVQVRTGFIDSLPITVTGSPGKLDVDANQQVKVV
jgi:hypothetical protein